MPYPKKHTSTKKFYRTNQYIRANELRVLGQDGAQIGVMSSSDAYKLAKEQGLDLIEIAPKAEPPVARIADFKKFLYQESKKQQAQSKKTKKGGMKEIRLTPLMAEADLQVRVKRINEFLNDRYKVRISVKFPGRLMGKKQFGYQIVEKVLAQLGDKAKVDQPPKFIGRQLLTTITSA